MFGIWSYLRLSWTTAHQYLTSPIVNGYVQLVVMKSLYHVTGWVLMDVEHLLLLELFARWHTGSGSFPGQLQTVSEDVFICAVLVCSAHYRLFYKNALYKSIFDICHVGRTYGWTDGDIMHLLQSSQNTRLMLTMNLRTETTVIDIQLLAVSY